MARPSMTALLAVLAVAGYQHRDKLAEMFARATGSGSGSGDAPPGEAGRAGGASASRARGMGGSGSIGGMLSGGLSDLIDQFRQSGQSETADSWVAHGPNRQVAPHDLGQAIGAETLDTLSRQTGLPRQELVARLSRELPDAVDRYTPEGRIPDA